MDKIGRRKMLIQSTIQSLLAQAVLAIIFAVSINEADTFTMGTVPARASIILASLLLLLPPDVHAASCCIFPPCCHRSMEQRSWRLI